MLEQTSACCRTLKTALECKYTNICPVLVGKSGNGWQGVLAHGQSVKDAVMDTHRFIFLEDTVGTQLGHPDVIHLYGLCLRREENIQNDAATKPRRPKGGQEKRDGIQNPRTPAVVQKWPFGGDGLKITTWIHGHRVTGGRPDFKEASHIYFKF